MNNTQFIIDEQGEKLAVILPIKAYQKILEKLDELEDIQLYDKAKKDNMEFIDADKAFGEIEKKRRKEKM